MSSGKSEAAALIADNWDSTRKLFKEYRQHEDGGIGAVATAIRDAVETHCETPCLLTEAREALLEELESLRKGAMETLDFVDDLLPSKLVEVNMTTHGDDCFYVKVNGKAAMEVDYHRHTVTVITPGGEVITARFIEHHHIQLTASPNATVLVNGIPQGR